ncbi:ParM/StbA family protein [Neobacillus drentensis]|uniref:ParM/StbA family protein n=1 Tax=Neobacillus drentensis TaxID=220684 RepID=UPI002FFE6FEB
MQEKILISIDTGKHSIKALLKYQGQIFTIMFRSKLQKVERFGIDLEPNSYHVKFGVNEYLIGDMVSEDYSDFTLSKTSLLHQLSIYTCIAVLLEKAKIPLPLQSKIHLAINAPINVYKDTNLKEAHRDLIENSHQTILISVNNRLFSFRLDNVIICFEGMGSIYDQMDQFKNKTSIIVDIGGLNTTLCSFKGIQPLFNTMTVSNQGINVLKGKVGKVINERFGLSVSADDLEQILQRGYLAHKGQIIEESKQFIEEIKREHLLQIIQFAQSREYTFNTDSIHFCGGGAYLLEKFIKEEFPFSNVMVNPQFANAKSFLKILEIKANG